ncbi:hypothetical protein FOA52_015092 [Chlamydomonas sp. UWO 241]|nr:hypothetical protein FOA52_015092 [Chlamydomonas sp. UWO 241]
MHSAVLPAPPALYPPPYPPIAQPGAYAVLTCVPQFGRGPVVSSTLGDFGVSATLGLPLLARPRDLGFHPTTGELWVANNDTQALTLLSGVASALGLGTAPLAAAIRTDRANYHYMARLTSVAFGRNGMLATCQESENDYDGLSDKNYFMENEKYYDGLSDKNDFVTETAWGTVLWAAGARYDPNSEKYTTTKLTLLRYDFERPHTTVGLVDHSLANIRRYHDVEVTRVAGVPSHLAVDPHSSALFIADTGGDRVIIVDRTTGIFDRHARADQDGEYSVFTSSAPTFEYSIYKCVAHRVFANVTRPSGIAVNKHFVFVAEHDTGLISAFDKSTGAHVRTVSSGTGPGLMGLELGPDGALWFVNGAANRIGRLAAATTCTNGSGGSEGPLPPPPSIPAGECTAPSDTALPAVIAHSVMNCSDPYDTNQMCLGPAYGQMNLPCRGPSAFNPDMLVMTGQLCQPLPLPPLLLSTTCGIIGNTQSTASTRS